MATTVGAASSPIRAIPWPLQPVQVAACAQAIAHRPARAGAAAPGDARAGVSSRRRGHPCRVWCAGA